MGVDMNELENKINAMQSKLNTLSIFEKIEFERRLRSILNSKSSKNEFIKKYNMIEHAYQDTLKGRTKTEYQFLFLSAIFILMNYFFNVLNEIQVNFVEIVVVIIIATYELKKEIFDSKYFLVCKNFDFEIERCKNDINQYGIFHEDSDLFHKFDEDNSPFSAHFYDKAKNAQVNLQIEILRFMNIEVEMKNAN